MRRTFPVYCLLLSTLILAGCVDFEEQTLSYRYDRENDRLLIFQLYRGIHADKGMEGPTEEEKEELHSVMHGERTFFFSNWLMEYDRSVWEDTLRKVPEKQEERPDALKPLHQAGLHFFERLLESVAVVNGAFFLCEDGRLCGYQFAKLSNASALVSLANALITQEYLADPLDKLTPGNQERVRAFAQTGEWLSLEDARLRIRYPQPFESYRSETHSWRIDPKTSDIVFNYEEPIAEVIIGRQDQEVGQLNGDSQTGKPRNLTAYVRDICGIRESVDIDALRRQFLATGIIPE